MSKILIVDDDENNRAVISDALDSHEFLVDEAVDGQSALRKVSANPPDLLLLDVIMPGMDGVETLKTLRSQEQSRDIPVIMVTSLDIDSRIAACLDGKSVDYIAKPFSNKVLRDRVQAALDSKSRPSDQQKAQLRRGQALVRVDAKGGVGTPATPYVGERLTKP